MPLELTLPDNPTLAEVRSQLQEAGDYLNGLRQVDRAKWDDQWRADVRSAVDIIHLLDGMESAMSAAEAGPAAALAGGTSDPTRVRSAGAVFTSDEGYRAFAKQGKAGATFYEIELRGSLSAQEFRDDPADIDSGNAGAFLPKASTAIPPVMRMRALRLRDIMSVQTTSLSSIPYIRENYVDETDAGFTAEGDQKNRVDLGWTDDDAHVRKITAWIAATTEIIEDAPTLRGQIDTRLVDKIGRAEEEAILAGPGTGATLKGILNFAGIQKAAYDEDTIVALAMAQAAIEDHEGEADAIVMRPLDYWRAITARHATQFDGGFAAAPGGALPFAGSAGSLPVWGLPVVRSRSCPVGKAVVGAFRQAATLFDRQRTVIRVGNQHLDFLTTNRVAIVAESRLALAVHRPDLFVEVPLEPDTGGA